MKMRTSSFKWNLRLGILSSSRWALKFHKNPCPIEVNQPLKIVQKNKQFQSNQHSSICIQKLWTNDRKIAANILTTAMLRKLTANRNFLKRKETAYTLLFGENLQTTTVDSSEVMTSGGGADGSSEGLSLFFPPPPIASFSSFLFSCLSTAEALLLLFVALPTRRSSAPKPLPHRWFPSSSAFLFPFFSQAPLAPETLAAPL